MDYNVGTTTATLYYTASSGESVVSQVPGPYSAKGFAPKERRDRHCVSKVALKN